VTTKVPQSQSDLVQQLNDHLGFLRLSAISYDSGFTSEAKRMAVSIRVLVHDTSMSHSLLKQLGWQNRQFYDTSRGIDITQLHGQHPLIYLDFAASRAGRFVPALDDPPGRFIPFDDWWNAPVLMDTESRLLTRKELILAVANKDGGAHVDPNLDETYSRLTRNNSLGWVSIQNDKIIPVPDAAPTTIRQITHEILSSLDSLTPPQTNQLSPDSMRIGGWSIETTLPMPSGGRNAPCPCGSGKKWKKCHGKPS
jgi:hypothetical protein